MKKIFALLLITAQLHAQRVPIADKTTGQSFTAAEFNLMKRGINGVPTVFIDMGNQYGIVCDGITDNWPKLQVWQNDWKGYKGLIKCYWPNGPKMLSSNNRWGYGIYWAEHYALNNLEIATITNSTDEKLDRAYWTGEMRQTNTMSYVGTITWSTNYKKFNTAFPGDTTITLTTAADTAIYKPGFRVFLASFDQIGTGFPPGTRYNEWNSVKANNLGGGKISLSKALVYLHDASLWDNPGGDIPSGQPRISVLPDSSYAYSTSFYNFTFGNPVGTSGATGTFLVIGNYVYCENCKFKGDVFPTQSHNIKFVNCSADGPNTVGAELDKEVGTFRAERCTWNIPVSNGTGIDEIYFQDNHFKESVLVCGKYVTYDHCDGRGNIKPNAGASAISAAPAGTPIISLKIINGCTFSRTSSNTANYAIDIPGLRSMVIAGVTGSTIMVPYTTSFNDANTALKVYSITKGSTLYKSDGSKLGIVDSMYWDQTKFSGAGAFMIAGNWAAPVVGETWYWSPVLSVFDDGSNKLTSSYSPSFARYSGEMMFRANRDLGAGGRQTIKLNLNDFRIDGNDQVVNLGAWLNSMEVSVTNEFKGSDSRCDLTIADSAYHTILQIDLKTKGTRVLTQDKLIGRKPNDVSDSSYVNKFHRQFHILFRNNAGSNLTDQTSKNMPTVTLTLQHNQ